MVIISRLATHKLCSQLLQNEKTKLLSIVRPITIQPKKVQPEATEGHDERNMRLGRPQSPHLTIYAPQLTTMLSISHRITGMALSGYAIIFGLGAIASPESIPLCIDSLSNAELGCATIMAGKFVLAFPLTYHFWNGIRHLLWDTGRLLTIKEVYTTGYIMLALSLASAVILSVM